MSIRNAYAAALQYLRTRNGSSQQSLAKGVDQSYISRLERADNSVTLEASESVADALNVDPLVLLTLAYAAKLGQSPGDVADQLRKQLNEDNLLSVVIPPRPSKTQHPIAAEAAQTRRKITELMEQKLSQSEIARRLGISRQSVSRHIKNASS
ncbi:helix-turn-helix domain-containing protein [Pseudomonas syringae]|uniref:helix-turn-helix domain-containing protein n=1 Tax=Pseudomonas syringae TaxID=317 RepID=UPI00070F4FB8|nr:helix-turn-helix domain-containing protein [Pseudomonas syringae]KWS45783.1 hypothetical protein AL060_12170 [Pseudomonas syringae pv. rhaphiolepidis]